MKTVTLLTSEESFTNNYGAALQGFALVSSLNDIKCQTTIIRYRGGRFSVAGKNRFIQLIKSIIAPVYRFFLAVEKNKLQNSEILEDGILNQVLTREKYFLSFQKETMTFYNDKRYTWKDLKQSFPDTDIYLCGSDQIWNPFFKGGYNDPGYFLAFVPEKKRKIAYAPSFGCKDLPVTAQSDLRELLASFDRISVRESDGVDIVAKYAAKEAKLVLDPTMLRTGEQWKTIARYPKQVPKHYILCYRFADSPHTKTMIDKLSEAMSLPVLSMPLSQVALKDDYIHVFEAGPREFVGLIEKADLVCTDSFHATVFSILLNTPVCVFLRESFEGTNGMNSRIYSLLIKLGLEQLIQEESDTIDKALNCLKIDYSSAYRVLDDMRNDSLAYLREAIYHE